VATLIQAMSTNIEVVQKCEAIYRCKWSIAKRSSRPKLRSKKKCNTSPQYVPTTNCYWQIKSYTK